MSARLRYLALTAARTRAVLPPLAAGLFLAIGTYAYRENEPGASFAVTSLMACGLAAWAVGAVLAGEPEPQHDMATAALGGRRARSGLEALLVGGVATTLTVVFVGVAARARRPRRAARVRAARPRRRRRRGRARAPLLRRARWRDRRALRAPRITRRATAIAAMVGALLGLVAVSSLLGPVGGPLAFADAEADAARGAVTGAALVACLSCLVLVAAALAAASRWAARAG